MEQSPDAESELLRQQRKLRPTSPHIDIYQPQVTWYLSGIHRITGCAIGAGKYYYYYYRICQIRINEWIYGI